MGTWVGQLMAISSIDRFLTFLSSESAHHLFLFHGQTPRDRVKHQENWWLHLTCLNSYSRRGAAFTNETFVNQIKQNQSFIVEELGSRHDMKHSSIESCTSSGLATQQLLRSVKSRKCTTPRSRSRSRSFWFPVFGSRSDRSISLFFFCVDF